MSSITLSRRGIILLEAYSMSGVFRNIDPSPPGECLPPPAFGAEGGHTPWVDRRWGVNSLEDARHCSVLYICKYLCFKNYRGISGEEGPQSDIKLPRSPFPGHFWMKTFCIAFHKSYLSTTCRLEANNSLMC
jgi:hypothetical protein